MKLLNASEKGLGKSKIFQRKYILILIIIFSVLAIDLPVMLAYQSSLFSLQLNNPEQVNTLNFLHFIFLLVVEIFILIIIYQKARKEFYKPFLYGGIVSSAVLLFTLLWALADFGSLFTFFHQIFFPMGNWQFAATGKLVNLFPFEFFYGLTKEIFIKSLIFSIIFIAVGLFLRKKRK
jgi:hypothetical protein